MIRDSAILPTIIAEYFRFLACIFCWHRILFHVLVDLSPPARHISKRFLTNWAAKLPCGVLIKTFQMHVVSTFQNAYRLDWGKHMLGTYWAVTVQPILEAHVVVEDWRIDTTATFVTVLVVDAKALPNTTQSTVFAVKNRLVSIRKQVTCITKAGHVQSSPDGKTNPCDRWWSWKDCSYRYMSPSSPTVPLHVHGNEGHTQMSQ